MGKLSRLRLKQQSEEQKNQEGVLEAELAMLRGTSPWNGENIPPAPPLFRRKRKSGK